MQTGVVEEEQTAPTTTLLEAETIDIEGRDEQDDEADEKFSALSKPSVPQGHVRRCTVDPQVWQQIQEIEKQHVEDQKHQLVCCGFGSGAKLTIEQMNKSWGRGGSWLTTAKMPKFREEKHSVRMFEQQPSYASKSLLDEWGVGIVNTKGVKGMRDQTVGQDNCSVSRLHSGWEVFCVMDGHGPDGHWPATRSVQTLPYFLQEEEGSKMLADRNVEGALLFAFCKTEADLVQHAETHSIDLQVCGCTATVALRNPKEHPGVIWIATVGDSRVALFSPKAEEGGDSVLEESEDHKPLLPHEKVRLEEKGCEVRSISHPNGYVETRVFVAGEDYPGLSMSRSFGDLLVKGNGVTWEPEVREWSVKDNPGALLCLASDGIWEFMSTEEVATSVNDLLSSGMTYKAVCSELVQRSRKLWVQSQGPFYCDDITMILFQADVAPAPISETVSEIEMTPKSGCNASCVVS